MNCTWAIGDEYRCDIKLPRVVMDVAYQYVFSIFSKYFIIAGILYTCRAIDSVPREIEAQLGWSNRGVWYFDSNFNRSGHLNI